MPLIDTHCHLDFYEDLEPILHRADAAGVQTLLAIGIGDGPATMHRALDLAAAPQLLNSPAIFATAGIHPQEAAAATPQALDKLTGLAQHPRCLAIGEIGLDYYHIDNPDISIQHQALLAQMRIAAAARKPIVLHLRTGELATPAAKARFAGADAAEDLLNLLETTWAPTGLPGILHCFSGTPDHAARALALGLYLSFAGNLTYPKSTLIQQVACKAPTDRILVETDAPFLTPIPHRGKQNEPALITHTAAFLANLRGLSPEALATQTTMNFNRLFPSTSST